MPVAFSTIVALTFAAVVYPTRFSLSDVSL
nr:MAG TPA: hypothetical protein [Caudoviricetes sp.]DAM12523.1 MAG TPA: hypothetical protein [Caudoviricetes sp.]DAT95945.1 MAG TPA: hypothetical protein [Caudoviricetes sp.]